MSLRPKEGPAAVPVPHLTIDDGQFDSLVRDLLEVIDDVATDVTPTMATVVRMEGGRVVCHIDGERFPRTVGFARKMGTRYIPNQRVSLKKNRSGEWIVDGPISSSPLDHGVGPEELETDAVGYRQLSFGSVSYDHLDDFVQSRIDAIGTGPDLSNYYTKDQSNNRFADRLGAGYQGRQMTVRDWLAITISIYDGNFHAIWARLAALEKKKNKR